MYNSRKIMDIVEENRARKRLSMQELADRVGVSRASISRYKNGSRDFPVNHAHKFAEVLGITTNQLLGMEEIDDRSLESIVNRLSEKNRRSLTEYAKFLLDNQK